MTKRASLDRLRDISKQRSIRRLPAARTGGDARDGESDIQEVTTEWPVPGSNHF